VLAREFLNAFNGFFISAIGGSAKSRSPQVALYKSRSVTTVVLSFTPLIRPRLHSTMPDMPSACITFRKHPMEKFSEFTISLACIRLGFFLKGRASFQPTLQGYD